MFGKKKEKSKSKQSSAASSPPTSVNDQKISYIEDLPPDVQILFFNRPELTKKLRLQICYNTLLVTATSPSSKESLYYLEIANNGSEVLYRSEDKKKSGYDVSWEAFILDDWYKYQDAAVLTFTVYERLRMQIRPLGKITLKNDDIEYGAIYKMYDAVHQTELIGSLVLDNVLRIRPRTRDNKPFLGKPSKSPTTSPPESQYLQTEAPDPSLIDDAVKHLDSTTTRANGSSTRELSIDEVHKGLTTLQSQAQNAIKGMTQRLDFQQGEQGKVEMAMREVHQILKTHQNEQRNLMRAVQQLKAPHLLSVDEMPLDLHIDLSRYSREAIVEYIDFLYSLIDQEINVRLKLEQSVTSLSNHIKLLSDNINMRMKQRGLI
jgi:hypothetical protein